MEELYKTKISITVWLTLKDKVRLDVIANRLGKPTNVLIEEIIRDYLDQYYQRERNKIALKHEEKSDNL
jgi:predicted DNA-binding protein